MQALSLKKQIHQKNFIMSVETRQNQIRETVVRYNLCVSGFEDDLHKIAQGYASVTGWSDHQKATARLAARFVIWSVEEVIFYNAVKRPQLFKDENANKQPYESWQYQHSLSAEELATEWVSDMNRMENKMGDLLGYPATEDGRYL